MISAASSAFCNSSCQPSFLDPVSILFRKVGQVRVPSRRTRMRCSRDIVSTYVFVSHDCGDGRLSRSRWSICCRWADIEERKSDLDGSVDLVKVVCKAGLPWARRDRLSSAHKCAKQLASAPCVGLGCPLSPAHVTDSSSVRNSGLWTVLQEDFLSHRLTATPAQADDVGRRCY